MLLTLPSTRPDLLQPGPPPDDALDPAHEAYGHAAALLASAQALEASTRADGSAPATAPALACLETSLEALSLTVESLRSHPLERLGDPWAGSEAQRGATRSCGCRPGPPGRHARAAAAACAPARRAVARFADQLADP
jgi:hypothetical protein